MPELLLKRFAAMPRSGVDPADGLRIEPGTIADFDALAHFHYKRGRPATWVKVLRVVEGGGAKGRGGEGVGTGGTPVPQAGADGTQEARSPLHLPTCSPPQPLAVLVISMPTLNGAWRRVAWPDDAPSSLRVAAERLNARVRCISRVVVDPRWRAMGVGARLVRAYLDDPLTERTETIASMGELCPIFRAAGMWRVEAPPLKADTHLREKLGAMAIDPADLADAPAVLMDRPEVVKALCAWGWQQGGHRRVMHRKDYRELARRAAERLIAPRAVYVTESAVPPIVPPTVPPGTRSSALPVQSTLVDHPTQDPSVPSVPSVPLPAPTSPPHLLTSSPAQPSSPSTFHFLTPPPIDRASLHEWIDKNLDIRILDSAIIDNHQSPMDYLEHVFFEGNSQHGDWLQRSFDLWKVTDAAQALAEFTPAPDAEPAPQPAPRPATRRGAHPQSPPRQHAPTARKKPREHRPRRHSAITPSGPPPSAHLPSSPPPPRRPIDSIVWSCRGGGKTFLGAVATALDLLFKPGIEIRILAGSLDQAQRMNRYLRRIFDRPNLFNTVSNASTARRLTLLNGSAVEVLAQSETSVRGNRVQRIRCDEVELFTPEVWEAAQLTTQSKQCGPFFVTGSVECLSTMHKPHGRMAHLVAEVADEKRTLFKWGLIDALTHCADDHHCHGSSVPPPVPTPVPPGTRSSALPVQSDSTSPVPPGMRSTSSSPSTASIEALPVQSDPTSVMPPVPPIVVPDDRCSLITSSPAHLLTSPSPHERRVTLPILHDSGPRTQDSGPPSPCPLLPECNSRAKQHRTTRGHITIADAIRMKSRVSGAAWESEMLCLRPRLTDSVFPEFNPAIHVIHTDPPSLRAPSSTLPLGHSATPPLPIYCGIDFGYRAPTVVLWAALDNNTLFILNERVERAVILAEHVRALLDSPWHPTWIAVDPAGRAVNDQTGLSPVQVLRRAGFNIKATSLHLHTGLELIRARAKPANGSPPRLFIHARCKHLIESIEKYHYDEDRPQNPDPVKDGPDHAVDALRYLIQNLDKPWRTTYANYLH
ncbi:MAG: hypothetical protein ACKVU4_14735 [Phycisphaerales bacterium]